MKRYGLIIGIILIAVAYSTATQVRKKELEQLVAESAYIVIAKVVTVRMFDKDDKEILDGNSRTGPGTGNEMRLYLSVVEVKAALIEVIRFSSLSR